MIKVLEAKKKKEKSIKVKIKERPEALREKWEKELIEEKGQEWFDKNKKFLDAQWEYVEDML